MPTQINAKKNFLVCNVVVATLFIWGNLTLPSEFWVYDRLLSTPMCLEYFLVGVLASEVVIVGVYTSFCRAFYVVRWAWSILTAVVCSMLLYLGIYLAEIGELNDSEMLRIPILAYALVGNLVTIGVGTCVRWLSGLNLTLESNSDEKPADKSFDLLFLFKLTFAIAILVLVFKMFTFRIPEDWDLRTVVVIVFHAAMHILLCTALMLCSLLISRQVGTAKWVLQYLEY